MIMNPTDMAEAIYTEMKSVYWPTQPLPPDVEAETKKYYKTLATAIINYIESNLDVLLGYFNVPSTGNVTGIDKIT
jgi:hypothetical protein